MYSSKFWEVISELEVLTLDEVAQIIEENKSRSVPFPENMLLRQIQQREKLVEKNRHLLPERHPDSEFFMADGIDLPYVRDDIASMEYPIFALKAGDAKDVIYEHNGFVTQIKPTSAGRATIFDKDVWIYCISKLMQAKFEGQEIKKTIRFSTYDFLVQTNKKTGGSQYEQFQQSLERLKGTIISTEVKTGGKRQTDYFGLIESASVVEEGINGKAIAVEITLPDWLYQTVLHNEVLGISKDYFRLRKPIDRRIYEISRKHCGRQSNWKITLELLHQKTGATMALKEFRRSLNSLAEADVLPDYLISYDRKNDLVKFTNRDESAAIRDNQQLIKQMANAMLK